MFFAVIWLAKLTGVLSRLFGRGGGSALPGLLAERGDNEILAQLGRRLSAGSIVVTGTNGKTTTTKMIQEILESVGITVITNRSGSNLSRGIVSSMIEQISWSGKFEAELGLFEVDEASMPSICRALQPKAVMVLNLFRDQLDRYGELDTTASMIGAAIEPLSHTQIYLNADDPLVASLAHYSADPLRVHYFGVEQADTVKLPHDLAADSDHCPADGQPLTFSRNFFGHIGHYSCPNGDFSRPEPSVKIQRYRHGKAFDIVFGNQTATLLLPLPGLYNAYNALAAAALAVGMGIDLDKTVLALERVAAAFGRVERLEIDRRIVYILLIKNPTGFNQIIQTFLTDTQEHHVMIAINDNFADGRDVSWLWDVAIEDLRSDGLIVSGIRALDMALRFKYAGRAAVVEAKLGPALMRSVAEAAPGETVYILPTYTAMLEIRNFVRTMGIVKGYW